MRRFHQIFGLLLVLLFAASPLLAQKIPPVPADGKFVIDYARALQKSTMDSIGEVQRVAYTEHHTPIIVVTVRSMRDYGAANMSIDEFTTRWFNQWGIGKKLEDGSLSNNGILLLVSLGDRKARIELGADWGRSFDGTARNIMDNRIIPHFKAGDFNGGILAGTRALGEMAVRGPKSQPTDAAQAVPGAPSPLSPGVMPSDLSSPDENITSSSDESIPSLPDESIPGPMDQAAGRAFNVSPFSKNALMGMMGLGVLLIIAAIFLPQYRKPLLIAGGALIVIGMFTWVILIILAMIFGRGNLGGRGGGGGGSSSGGFSSGGGGFSSGGFSGGGGASGSW